MKLIRLFLIGIIFTATTFGWWLLSSTIHYRTSYLRGETGKAVSDVWGPPIMQHHPVAKCQSSEGGGATDLHPSASKAKVKLDYDPKKRGLLWHRTYKAAFQGEYTFTNTTAITQTLRVSFSLPGADTMCDKFSFQLGEEGDAARAAMPEQGVMTDSIQVAPGASVPLRVSYETRGKDTWHYQFPETGIRIRDFDLSMETDFEEINFPVSSPTERVRSKSGWTLGWKYPDVIAARGIAMDMPAELQAGPVAQQIALYAPLSLFLFFAVVLITCLVRDIDFHPVNYLFLAAGFFAFPLLFAYMLDVAPVHLSFAVASGVSVALVAGYLRAAAGGFLFRVAFPAQLAYMVLFSYSFFFKGLTGLTLTIGGIVTLGVLMALTARVNWSEKLSGLSPKLA